jgi:hypothetical protein
MPALLKAMSSRRKGIDRRFHHALLDESEVGGAQFIAAACHGALARPQTAQLSAKHDQP